MDIDGDEARNVEDLLREDLAVGHDDEDVELLGFCRPFVPLTIDRLRLPHGKGVLLCDAFHRRCGQCFATTDGTIKLRNDELDGTRRIFEQRLQCMHCEVGSAAEDDAHPFRRR